MSAISQISIFKPNGNLAITTAITDSSQRVRKLMAENYIELNFRSESYVDIPVGSTISYLGFRFKKIRKQVPTYENGGWTYTEQFEDADGDLRRFRIKYRGQDFQEMSFALTATLSDFAALVTSCINTELTGATYVQTWIVGTIDAALENDLKTISFAGDTLFDACTAIAEAYDTEWWISKAYVSSGSGSEQIYLNFCKKEGTEVDFETGRGKILNMMNPQRGEDGEYGTRFFVFGGTRNLTDDYKEVPAGSSVPNLYENRLHLPDNQAYIDARNGQIVQDLALNEILEQYVTFDDIFPKNRDTVTAVYSQTVVDEDDNEYTQYTIQADDCPFAGEGDIIDTLGIKFETGELAGQEFEAQLQSQSLPWNKKLIIVAKDFGTDGQHLFVPNPSIKPSVGDVFVLTGVKLPSSKISDAEDELLATGEDYAKQHSSDTDVYECISNNVYCYEHSATQAYDIGTKVKLKSTDIFGANGRSSRIQGVSYCLTKPWEITWEVGDNTKYSRFGSVETTISEVTYSQRLGVRDNTIYNLIKSTDYQSPSDENIYSALAAYNHIYKKHDHKGRLIRPAVFVTPTQSPAEAGFSLDDNEVALWCDTNGNYTEAPTGGGVANIYDLTIRRGSVSAGTYNLGEQAADINLSSLFSGYATESWVSSNFNNYTLPTASSSTKGGIKVGSTLTISSEVLNVVTGSVTQSNTGFVTGGDVYSAIAAAVTSALHYRGISSTALTDGGTETATIGGVALTPQSGDVVIYVGFEFLWENNVWNKLGDDTSYALKTITITGDGTYITGGGDLTTARTLTLGSGVITSLGKADTAYQKPSGGIPASDLADAYLKLSGNSVATKITGDVYMTRGKYLKMVESNGTDSVNLLGISSSGAWFTLGNGSYRAEISSNNSDILHIKSGASYAVYDESNLTKSVLTTLLESSNGYYVKKAGDTMTGDLTFDASSANRAIAWKDSSSNTHYAMLMCSSGVFAVGYNQIARGKYTLIEGSDIHLQWNTTADTKQAILSGRDFRPKNGTNDLRLGHPSYYWSALYASGAKIPTFLAIPQSAPSTSASWYSANDAYLYADTSGNYSEEAGGGVANVYPLTITINGTSTVYNPGSAAQTVSFGVPTSAQISAWNAKYDKPSGGIPGTDLATAYLPLAGGTMSNTNVVTNMNADLLDGHHGSEYIGRVHYGTTGGSSSGWYKININSTSQWMLAFTVRIYQGYTYYDIVFSGYNYTTNHWYRPQAVLLGSTTTSIEVKFGYDSGYNLWVAVPYGSYAGIDIFDVTNGYGQVTDIDHLFTITQMAELSGTVQETKTIYRPATTNEMANYLPLSGGIMTGQITSTAANNTDALGGSIKLREYNYVQTAQSDWFYCPSISFMWGGRSYSRLGLRSDGKIAIDNYPLYHTGNLTLATLAGSSAVGSSTQPVYYTGSALAACDYSFSQMMPVRNYDCPSGNLVRLDISASSNSMIYVRIESNSYNSNGTPNITLVNFYNYNSGDRIINYTATQWGIGGPTEIKIFNYDSKVYIWFAQPTRYQTYFVTAMYQDVSSSSISDNSNKAVSISNAAIPSSGVTRLVTITPANVAMQSELSDYLPLSGGTMTGDITLTDGKFVREKGSNNAILGINSGSFIVGSPSHPAIIRTDGTAITRRTPSANYTVYDTGNLTKSVLTTLLDASTGTYLPLTAGSSYPLTGHLCFNTSEAARQIVWTYGTNQANSGIVAFMATTGHLYLGYNQIDKSKYTYLDGYELYLRWNTAADTRTLAFTGGNIRTTADNKASLGTSSYRWSGFHSMSANLYGNLAFNAPSAGNTITWVNSSSVTQEALGMRSNGHLVLGANQITNSKDTYIYGTHIYVTWKSTRQIHFTGDTIIPNSSNAISLGTSSLRWSALYSNGADLDTFLAIPQSAPSNPDASKHYLYVNDNGNYYQS